MESAQQQTTEQQQENLRELKKDIYRIDIELSNIEFELRVVLARFGDQWHRGFDMFSLFPCTLFSLTAYFGCVRNARGKLCLHSPMRPSFL